MTALFDWFGAKRWRLSLSHCFEMWIIWIPLFLLTQSTVSAGVAVVAWYWSRKKMEVEVWNGHDKAPAASWSYGWFPWSWGDRYMVLDVALPAIIAMCIAVLDVARR